MSFWVVVTRTAARQLAEHLPEAAAAASVEFLFGPLTDNPRRVGTQLRAPFAGQWRARRGEYRVRYRIDDTERAVYVLDIDHRRDAYRNCSRHHRGELASQDQDNRRVRAGECGPAAAQGYIDPWSL